MIYMHSKYDNIHKNRMFHILICINNHIISCYHKAKAPKDCNDGSPFNFSKGLLHVEFHNDVRTSDVLIKVNYTCSCTATILSWMCRPWTNPHCFGDMSLSPKHKQARKFKSFF